jgi:hypothetical protein
MLSAFRACHSNTRAVYCEPLGFSGVEPSREERRKILWCCTT